MPGLKICPDAALSMPHIPDPTVAAYYCSDVGTTIDDPLFAEFLLKHGARDLS